ncbi:succinylglutamate desuccinylase/aspartoacylase family protein [Nonlabens antarcticus]|uniref:succinylglutamate desuccinylase/aspartoacylase family protein n=1 Tax=Nonlabens antarcticus TaxID=392714 RepID=UPI001E28DB2B|nr:succinylglutamate desuccinylase/aspartoacylase family protein [Nonlabens antarcticus]
MATDITILGTVIKPGTSHTLNFNMARLYTSTVVDIPVIIHRAKRAGPIVLLTGGLHGDEFNGVEVVRQLISKKVVRPKKGMIIAIPVVNVFGFLNMQREFPDGRDLNRVFPGTKNGSLASRFAYQVTKGILPHVDLVMDFHTGGAQRFNAPQLRVDPMEIESLALAHVFQPPFLIHSKNIPKTFRETCCKMGKKYLLFEGGKSQQSDKNVILTAVNGAIRIIDHLGMLQDKSLVHENEKPVHIIKRSKWVRARYSGLLHPRVVNGKRVEKGEMIASITDPYGTMRHKVNAPHDGFVINVNHSPLVYQGDAIFHISKDEE